MKRMLIPAMALLVLACGKKDDNTDDDDTNNNNNNVTAPMDGSWALSNMALSSNDCGLDAPDDGEAGNLIISDSDDSGFHIVLDEGLEADCTLASDGFTCDAIEQTNDFNPDANAIVTFDIDIAGEFTDMHSGSINLDIGYSCEGPDCDALSTQAGLPFPCSSSFTADINHAG